MQVPTEGRKGSVGLICAKRYTVPGGLSTAGHDY